jgi:anti-anti-sigma factor
MRKRRRCGREVTDDGRDGHASEAKILYRHGRKSRYNARLWKQICRDRRVRHMSTTTASPLKIATTDNGCCIRVEGKGTMNESQAAHEVAIRALQTSSSISVVLDLTSCSYLDSTFLGCILDLYKHYGRSGVPRFMVAGSSAQRHKLFAACGIEKVIPAVESAPPVHGEWVPLTSTDTQSHQQLMRHVMECHRTLAQVDTPMKVAFAKIADEIEKDLNKV